MRLIYFTEKKIRICEWNNNKQTRKRKKRNHNSKPLPTYAEADVCFKELGAVQDTSIVSIAYKEIINMECEIR